MKNKNNLSNTFKDSFSNFFQSLQQKSSNFPSQNQQKPKVKQSIKPKSIKNHHKKQPLPKTAQQQFTYLNIQQLDLQPTVKFEQYQFTNITTSSDMLVEKLLQKSHNKLLISMSIQKINNKPEISLLKHYIQKLIKKLNKIFLSIYIRSQKSENKFYDMLSIRKQTKNDTKSLVKANICNNSKSNVILKKLLDFAIEREKVLHEDGQTGGIVVRIVRIGEQDSEEKQNCNRERSGCIQMSLSSERKVDEIFKGMYTFVRIFHISPEDTESQIRQFLQKYKKQTNDNEEMSQQKLMAKIKTLHEQLQKNRQQLNIYKSKAAEKYQEQQLLETVPPSERAMVDIEKYEKYEIKKVGDRK